MSANSKMIFCAALVAAAVVGSPMFAAGGGSAPSSPPPQPSRPAINPQQSYAEGVAALQAGDYKKADKKFSEVLTVAPNNPEANYYLGLAKTKLGKDKQSIRYFERAIKNRPEFIEAREQLALAQIRLAKPEAAQAELAKIKEILAACTPEACDAALLERGAKMVATIEAMLAGGAAPSAAEQGADLGGSERFGYLLLESEQAGLDRYRDGVKLVNESRFAAAYEAFADSAAAIGPHPDVLNYLGFTSRKQGKFDAAKRYYAQALDLDPYHKGATEYLGELHLELGDVDAARAQLAKLEVLCAFGCAEREDLARLIAAKESIRAALR